MMDKSIIPDEVWIVLNMIERSGFRGYLVGGCVRDMLMGRSPKDYDICTDALPEQIKGIFPRVFDTGIKHGTVTVKVENMVVEVTTFRCARYADRDYRDDVNSLSEKEDVEARDYTINGLLYDGVHIIDYVGGRRDIEQRIIRAIGNPEYRIMEDPLRMIRAIRLATELRFDIENDTWCSIKKNAYLIQQTAVERIRDELTKILISDDPVKGITMLKQTGILSYIWPEIEHSRVEILNKTPKNRIVRLAALFYQDGDTKNARKIMSRMKYDKRTSKCVMSLVQEKPLYHEIKQVIDVKKLMIRIGTDNLRNFFSLQRVLTSNLETADLSYIEGLEAETERILDAGEPLLIKDLAITGKDLINIGIKSGTEIGHFLNRLLAEVMQKPELNEKEKLIKLVSCWKK